MNTKADWSNPDNRPLHSAAKPTCALSRLIQEQDAQGEIMNSEAVWSNATKTEA